jgi:hypothetical protein
MTGEVLQDTSHEGYNKNNLYLKGAQKFYIGKMQFRPPITRPHYSLRLKKSFPLLFGFPESKLHIFWTQLSHL